MKTCAGETGKSRIKNLLPPFCKMCFSAKITGSVGRGSVANSLA
jgi:hypothetical protein